MHDVATHTKKKKQKKNRKKKKQKKKREAHGPQCSSELQFQSAITCFLDWDDNSCMLDLKQHSLLTCVFYEIGDVFVPAILSHFGGSGIEYYDS